MKYVLTYDNNLMVIRKQNILFLKNKLSNTIFYTYGTIMDENNHKLLRYVVITLFLFYKEKIVNNYLQKKIKLIRSSFFSMSYYFKVEKDIYKIKFAFLPYSYKCCKIFKNDKIIANVDKKYKKFPPHTFEITFVVSNINDHLLGLIYLLISLTLVDEL